MRLPSVPPAVLARTVLQVTGLVFGPALVLAVHDPWLALGGVPDVALLLLVYIALARQRPELAAHPAVRVGLTVAWAIFALFGVAWTASLVATTERLPLYDLLLLVRPVWVFATDLQGPLAPWAAFGGVALLAALATGAASQAWAQIADPATRPLTVGLAAGTALLGLLATGPWTPGILDDLAASVRLYASVQTQLTARQDLDARRPHLPARRAAVRRRELRRRGAGGSGGAAPPGDAGQAPSRTGGRGWSLASGRATSPTHGGRSWLADATVLSGLQIDRQATFDHVTAHGTTIPSLPRFFATRGYRTVLVRPKDRARPGVRLVNRFGFATTVFHDDLHYTGPSVGWGHIPDQYTVEVTERDVLAALDEPFFAFFHLATSHYPWDEAPPLLDDAREWQSAADSPNAVNGDRKPWFALGMQLSRYRSERRALKDRHDSDLGTFQTLVAYDLKALVKVLAEPSRPTLAVWFGDHQPPFLADGAPADAVVHVVATDPGWLEPFLAAGFRRGLDPGPRGSTRLHHRDLFDVITAALGAPVRPDDPPQE